MYTGTFTFMPAEEVGFIIQNEIVLITPRQFQVNLISWRLSVSKIVHTYDDTENVMIIDGHTLPCYFADGFSKPTTKIPHTVVWFIDVYFLIFTLQIFVGRMTKVEVRHRVEIDSFVHFSFAKKRHQQLDKETLFPFVHAPHTQKPHNPSLSRFEIFPHAQTFCTKPEPFYATQYSDLFV